MPAFRVPRLQWHNSPAVGESLQGCMTSSPPLGALAAVSSGLRLSSAGECGHRCIDTSE